MTPLEQYQHLLDTNGISLQALNIRGRALERSHALSAVVFLRKALIPILGGDTYVKCHSHIEFAYANWHSDSNPNEATNDYLSRSWDTTEKYIRDYPEPFGGTPLFSLVIEAC